MPSTSLQVGQVKVALVHSTRKNKCLEWEMPVYLCKVVINNTHNSDETLDLPLLNLVIKSTAFGRAYIISFAEKKTQESAIS